MGDGTKLGGLGTMPPVVNGMLDSGLIVDPGGPGIMLGGFDPGSGEPRVILGGLETISGIGVGKDPDGPGIKPVGLEGGFWIGRAGEV